MRIGYFADGPWSHQALEKMINSQLFKIVFIVGRCDKEDSILKEHAQRLKIPFLVHPNVNSSEFIEKITPFSADLLVSMSFNQILKMDIINLAPLGFINCHAGALPFYRGRNILNWALINGEKNFAVTVHYVDEGIDTGDIILQRFCEITPDDDYGTLLDKAYPLCADTLFDALVLIKEGQVKPIKQADIHPVGFYCGRRIQGDEWINWEWPSERIHNFIRALTTPGPGAQTFYSEETVTILKTEIIPCAPRYLGQPGEIVGRDNKGVIVKTGDSTIRVTQIANLDANGLPVSVRVPSFRVGVRLGFDLLNKIRELENIIKDMQYKTGF